MGDNSKTQHDAFQKSFVNKTDGMKFRETQWEPYQETQKDAQRNILSFLNWSKTYFT